MIAFGSQETQASRYNVSSDSTSCLENSHRCVLVHGMHTAFAEAQPTDFVFFSDH